MNERERNKRIVILGILASLTLPTLGVICGYNMRNNPVVEYISMEELINLEKRRIEHGQFKNDVNGVDNVKGTNEIKGSRELFFGRSKEAIELINKIANNRHGSNASKGNNKFRTTKILFTSGFLQGENVRSISEEVHQLVIRRLLEDKENS